MQGELFFSTTEALQMPAETKQSVGVEHVCFLFPGLVLGSLRVKRSQKLLGASRCWHSAFDHDILGADFLAIKALVRAVIRTQGGTLQRYSCKGSTGSRVAENLRAQGSISRCRSIS